MSARAFHLVIDARPRGLHGPLAAEVVLGRSVLDHLLEVADRVAPPEEPVVIHAREDEHRRLRELAPASLGRSVQLVCGPPRADAAVLRTDRYYDAGRLKHVLRRGGSPETAVLWRLDRPETLANADAELTRRRTYQPLGKYWAFPLADRLAEWLRPTAVRPNAVTLASAGLMLSAAALESAGFSAWGGRLAIALALAVALVLDTADGRLARLQGTSSSFGRWLDQVLDELVDIALHAAIAWAAFCREGQPGWLLLGMLYASSKYLFQVQSLLGEELESDMKRIDAAPGVRPPPAARRALAGRCSRRLPRWCGSSATPICAGTCGSCWRSWAVWTWLSSSTRSTSRSGRPAVRSGRGCAMPDPRVSVLIVAKNEAHNLADCLAAASWADERVVVVDAASRDATAQIARAMADVVIVRGVRRFRQPAQLLSTRLRATGSCRSTPTSGPRPPWRRSFAAPSATRRTRTADSEFPFAA